MDLVDGAGVCDLLAEYRLGVVMRERFELDVKVDHASLDAIQYDRGTCADSIPGAAFKTGIGGN